ncbi:MAG: hypothetical protein ABIU54_03120 [Candidatus Eisenbacteria bacterium]
MIKPRFVGLATLALSVALFAASAFAATEKCPAGEKKIEAGPWQYCSTTGIITSICVKAGTQTFSFTADGESKCYTVKGIGTACVYVTGGGTSSECKDISGITFYVDKK